MGIFKALQEPELNTIKNFRKELGKNFARVKNIGVNNLFAGISLQ